MNLSAQRRIKEMHPMNEGAMPRDERSIDGALDAQRSVARSGERQPAADRSADDGIVLLDTRGQQINPLLTTMTAAEALEDSLGPRR